MINKKTFDEDELAGIGENLFQDVKRELPKVDIPSEFKEKKGPRVKRTQRQKALRVMLKRSGLKSPPLLHEILKGKVGAFVHLNKIGFLSHGSKPDPLMEELGQECPVVNHLNRDDVTRNRVQTVGAEIFKAGRMWNPIHIYKDEETGKYECISGRHRLAFLAIAYGTDILLPVYIEKMTQNEAKSAVAVANDGRPVKALERASYAIQSALKGGVVEDQEKLYAKMATRKSNVGKYCVFCVCEKKYPLPFSFKVSELSSRHDGSLMTIRTIESFWNESFSWKKGISRQDFDKKLGETVKFLNAFVAEIQNVPGFDLFRHLTAPVLGAIGRYYLTCEQISRVNAIIDVENLAKAIVVNDSPSKDMMMIYNEVVKYFQKYV
jgi:hypothetical protein